MATKHVIISASESITGGAPSISFSDGGSSFLSFLNGLLSMGSGSSNKSSNLVVSNTSIKISKKNDSEEASMEVSDDKVSMSMGGDSKIEVSNTGISVGNTLSVNTVAGTMAISNGSANVLSVAANGLITISGGLSINGETPMTSAPPVVRNVGGVIAGMGSTPPLGTLFCNGSYIAVATYPDLCAYIGNTYGTGNTTHRKLPDLRGYFLRGLDAGAGIDPNVSSRTNRGDGTTGGNVGTKQACALENITGSINFMVNRRNLIGAGGALQTKGTSADCAIPQTTGTAQANGDVDFDASRVVKTSTETRPINIAVNWCIIY